MVLISLCPNDGVRENSPTPHRPLPLPFMVAKPGLATYCLGTSLAVCPQTGYLTFLLLFLFLFLFFSSIFGSIVV
jgi:hypothetical protein